jgi:hypothetical protein
LWYTIVERAKLLSPLLERAREPARATTNHTLYSNEAVYYVVYQYKALTLSRATC